MAIPAGDGVSLNSGAALTAAHFTCHTDAPMPPDTSLKRQHSLGILLVLLAAVLWSSNGMFIKLLHVEPLPLTALRALFAALTLAPFIRRAQLRWDPAMLGALVSYPVLVLCFVSATKWTTAANAIALQSTSPAWMFLFSAIALRQLPLRLFVPIAVILGGIVVILLEPATGINATGNLVALVAGVCWASFAFSYARVRTPGPGVICLCNLVTFVALLIVQPGEVLSTAAPGAGIRLVDWLMLIYLGVVQQGGAFVLFAAAMRRISPTQVMVLVLLEPLLNPVWVYFVVGEAPSAFGLAGGGLILLGILLDIFIRRDPREAMRDAVPRVLPQD